jgi:hypothetical protein
VLRTYIRHPTTDDGVEYTTLIQESAEFLAPWVYLSASLVGYENYLEQLAGDNKKGFLFVCGNPGKSQESSISMKSSEARFKARISAIGLGLALPDAAA